MITYLDLLGRPYAEMRCGHVAIEVHRRAGHAVPDGALEDPRDFERWLHVAQPRRYTDGDVILGRTPDGRLFAGGIVDLKSGLFLTSSHSAGVFATRLREHHILGVYRWPTG